MMLIQEAGTTRLSGGTETLRGEKRHCWPKNKNLGWNHWNSSCNCIKSFFHISCFVTFHFHFFGTFYSFMERHHWPRCFAWALMLVGGEVTRQQRWRRYMELLSFDFWVSGQAPILEPSFSHLKLVILSVLNPLRCSELHMWSSLREKAPRFAVYWPRRGVWIGTAS